MRCLHCGKRLTLLRKLSDHEFCSEEHRTAFGREQEQLALARLIDAQQQSQQAVRKREKRRPAVVPEVTSVPERVAPFAWQIPAVCESSWCGYKREDTPLLESPIISVLPRLVRMAGLCRVPEAGSVWPDMRVEAQGTAAPLFAWLAEPAEFQAASTLAELTSWSGVSYAWTEGAKPDFRRVESVSLRSEPLPDLRVPEAGPIRWAAVVQSRRGAMQMRAIAGKPTPLRAGWDPEAIPQAGLRILQPESENRGFDPQSTRRLLAIGHPPFRGAPAGRTPVVPPPRWMITLALPRTASVNIPQLRRPSCQPLSLARLAAGDYSLQQLCEPPVASTLTCLVPLQNRSDDAARLRLSPRVSIPFPQADCGRNLLGVYPRPEEPLQFLVPPRSRGPAAVDFCPPAYGMRQISLSSRCDHELEAYRRGLVEGPFLPVPKAGTKPVFSAPLLCDWVPVRAHMMALPVEIETRNSGVRLGPADLTPLDAEPAATTPLPSLSAPLAGAPRLKGKAVSLRRITLDGMVPHQDALRPMGLLQQEEIQTGRVLPGANLRLAKDRPTLDIERRLTAPMWRKALYRAGDAWGEASMIKRLGGVLTAIVLAVFLAMPGTSQAGASDLQASLAGGWEHVQNNILQRAAVALTDDFRAGLAEWEGEGDWARAWSYDQSGFVRTGPLALYSPSLPLTNYSMEFLGQIEKRSLGWVVRASDSRNYYALKLTAIDPGPVPEIYIQRYPVIDGRPGPVKQKRLPIEVRMDTLYRVQVEVRDSDFTLSVQGKVVDSWSEPKLDRGGVGFFSGKGELARLRWVGVWHQYDTLGRLCALLAPHAIADRQRGVSQ